MSTTFTIQAAVLEAMQHFCQKPTATAHAALSELLIEITPEAVRLVATDGYVLGLMHLTAISGYGFALHACDAPTAVAIPFTNLAPAMRNRKDLVTFTLEGLTVTVEVAGQTFQPPVRSRDEYPDYRRVIPEESGKPVTRIGLDLALLSRFTAFAKVLKEEPHIDVSFSHALGPIGIRLKSINSFYGIVMPRQVAFDTVIPGWLDLPSSADTDMVIVPQETTELEAAVV